MIIAVFLRYAHPRAYPFIANSPPGGRGHYIWQHKDIVGYEYRGADWPLEHMPFYDLAVKLENHCWPLANPHYQPADEYPFLSRYFTIDRQHKAGHVYVTLWSATGRFFAFDTHDGRHVVLQRLDDYCRLVYEKQRVLAILPLPIAKEIAKWL